MTVVVATFGSQWWDDMAHERAIPSVEPLGWPVVHVHGETLHDARNDGLALVETPWVVHLDADDELETSYPRILAYAESTGADIVAPSVRYVRPGWMSAASRMPVVVGHPHQVCSGECLPDGNWLVVGALAKTDVVRAAGWRDWPCYEDWDMWLRCWRHGALIGAEPRAVYRAYSRQHSRNRYLDQAAKDECHRAIIADVLGARHG